MKSTFTIVRNEKGAEIHVPVWATFSVRIGDTDVLFKVTTAIGPIGTLVVTHAETGCRLCDVTWKTVAETRKSANENDYTTAGRVSAKKKLKGITFEKYQEAVKAVWEKLKGLS